MKIARGNAQMALTLSSSLVSWICDSVSNHQDNILLDPSDLSDLVKSRIRVLVCSLLDIGLLAGSILIFVGVIPAPFPMMTTISYWIALVHGSILLLALIGVALIKGLFCLSSSISSLDRLEEPYYDSPCTRWGRQIDRLFSCSD